MSRALTILVAGREGQVAVELARVLSAAGHRVTALGRPSLDLANEATIERAVGEVRPDLVVNAAAYTAVDKAEDERESAMAVNATGAGLLASTAARLGAPIVHFSTDYVFDGSKTTPYLETDATGPIGVYGSTKLEGERLVAAANPRHAILRTAWVFSPHGNNFVKTMLRLAGQRPELTVVDDQHGTPTSAADLADAVAHLAPRLVAEDAAPERFGVFHAVPGGPTTWCGFARAIMDGARERGAPAVAVRAITTAEFPTRARRPQSSVLSPEKLSRVHGIALPPWPDSLSRCLDALAGPRRDA